MKKIVVALTCILPLQAFFIASAQNPRNPEVLTKEIIYDVGINNFTKYYKAGNEESGVDYWYLDQENVLPVYRSSFLKGLFSLAYTNKLQLQDENNKPLSGEELKGSLTVYDTVHVDYNEPPYDRPDKVVVRREFHPEYEIKTIRFREVWKYDPVTMEIIKKVLAFAPLAEVYKEGTFIGNKVLFWVNIENNNANGNEKLLCQRIISYNQITPSDHKACISNKDTVKCHEYIQKLITKCYHDELKIYDPKRDDPSDLVPLPGAQFFGRFTRNDTLQLQESFPPYNFKDTTISVTLIPDKTTDIRFIEEWYIDPETMYFVKKVVGISPLLEEYFSNGEYVGFEPLFDIYFNDIWKPFGKSITIK